MMKPIMKEILETPRLVLRELSMADLDFVAAMLADPEVMRYWPKAYSRTESVDWIERQQDRYLQHGYGYWLMLDKKKGVPIGQAGLLLQVIDGREEVGLGYIIHRPFWRNGFATEASIGCLDYAFNKICCKQVLVLIRPENMPSLGVAAKLGLTSNRSTVYAGFEHLIFVATNDRRL